MKEKRQRSQCPISTALEIFGDKWSLLIIRDLMFKGKNTYGDFLSSEENISTNILADRLAILECSGIISKLPHPDSKAKTLYKLTEKGVDLIPVLIEIVAWAAKHENVDPYAREFTEMVDKDKSAFIERLREDLAG